MKAKPFDVQFDPKKTAILVIDMQNEWCSKGGEADRSGADIEVMRKPIKPIQNILEVARAAGCPIIYTKAGHRPDLADVPKFKMDTHRKKGILIGSKDPHGGRTHIRGTWSTEIVNELKPLSTDIIIDNKSGYNAFYYTELDPILRNLGVETLVITGVVTSACVESTVRDAADRGYYNVVLSDGCADYKNETHKASLAAMEGLYAFVTTSHEILNAFEKHTSKFS